MEEEFDKDITVINRYFDKTNKAYAYKVSYIKGFWDSSSGIKIGNTQLTKNDKLQALILINDSRNEMFQTPEEFKESQSTWTLQNDDYLVKGKVKDFTTVTELLENYADVIKISKIAIRDYGTEDMWHFEIEGE